jgi:hypothetical protein
MNSPGPQQRTANVSEWLEAATQLFRVTLLKCLPLATVAVLFSDVPNLYWIASGHDLSHGLPSGPSYWILSMIATGFTLYIGSAVMLQQRSVALGVSFGAVTALATAARRLPVLLLSWLLAWLSLLVGVVLLVLPGVFLMVCYLVLVPVVLFERQSPHMALVRCVLLVRPHWWKMFAALVIALLVALVGMIALAAILDILATLLAGEGPAFQAIMAAGSVVIAAVALAFLSALALTLHSALASSSA